MDLRDPAQRLGPLRGILLQRCLALQQGRHAIPALALQQQAALRLARARVGRRQLLDAPPGVQRPLGVAEVLLGDDGDLLQPPHLLVGGAAAHARPLERELQQIGQRAPVALVAEVIGVGAERVLVLGIDLQDRVQVDRRLIAVAQAVAVQRRELAHDAHALGGLFDRAQLALAQLGQLGVVVAGEKQLDQPGRRRAVGRLERRDLAVDPLRLGGIVHLALGELRALVEEVDPLRLGGRRRDPLAVVAIQLLIAAPVVVDPLQQLGRLGVARHRLQRAPQRRDGVVGVARLLPAARDLEEDRRGALQAVGADPVGVAVDRRQQLQRLLVARAQPDHLAQTLGGGVELLELLREHAAEAQQQVGAALGLGRPFELQLVQAHDGAVVAERAVDLARRLDRLDVLLGELAGALSVADVALQPGEVVDEQLPHLRLQLGDARGVTRARDRRRLHLEHRHVVGGAALLAINVLEARGSADVAGIAIDGVGQVDLGPFTVAQLIDAQLGGQVEQLGCLGTVLDRLGARLVQRDQLVVLLGLP